MTETTYTYSISEDFLNSIVDTSSLTTEIHGSAITIALDHIDTNDGYCDIVFKAALLPGEEAILNGLVAAHTGASEAPAPTSVVITDCTKAVQLDVPSTDSGLLRVVAEKTDVDRLTLITHNWADPTTWYEQSIRVLNETPTNSGDNKSYKLAHAYVIDTCHGKLFGEDALKNTDGYSYRVSVKVNGTSKTEQDPHYGTGGHFTINYKDGYIDFIDALEPTDTVTVTYFYQNGSTFTLKPSAGKNLKLTLAEVQFSTDVVLTDTIVFQTYGYAGVFAPQLGYPFTTLIPIQTYKYKTIQDYIADSVKSHPIIQALGGSGWRGMNYDIVLFDWDYVSAAVIHSAYGMETRVYLEHNTPIQGSYATSTFYFTVEDA